MGSGKSAALCQEAIRLSYLNPGRRGLIGAPTYPMLRDSTLTSMLSILGANRIPYEYNKAENTLLMHETKSRILFRSLDDFERLRGTNLAWFGVDELTYTAEDAWLRLEGRLRDPKAKRLCGFAVWTPKGFDWVYRKFVKEPAEGYDTIFAKAFENRFVLDRVPDYYERLKRSYDERFFAQEALGEYLSLNAGRVYEAFDRGRNVRDVAIDPALPLLWALDFNVDPMCSVLAQRSGAEIRVIDEIVLRRASTTEACEEFRSRYPQYPERLVIYGDATGARQQTSGTSDYKMVRDYLARTGYRRVEFRVPTVNPSVRERVAMMNAKFRSAAGDSELTIDGRCKELVRDFEEVMFKPDSMVIDKERDPRRTHLSDALGYLVWQECRPQPSYGERGERLL
ncbi:MAG TPA: terminase family protein [Bryobacteraceae bacterium]|nr:terminase family protein [Bryobacteraceae bacterium]